MGFQVLRHRIRAHIARLARAMAEKTPEIGAVIHVEHHLATMRFRDADRLLLRGCGCFAGKMGAGYDDGCGRSDEALVDIVLVSAMSAQLSR
jgi:hypothetical protein